MASRKSKDGDLLSVGDVVDVRGKIEQIDLLSGLVYVRVGATVLAFGTATTENVPDPSQVLRVNSFDCRKVP